MLLSLIASALLIVGVGRLAEATVRVCGGGPGPVAVRTGVVAAAIAAVFPDAITSTGLVMTDLVGATGVVWTATMCVRIRERATMARWVAAAACAAAVLWFRPSYMLLPLLAAILLAGAWRAQAARARWQSTSAAVAVLAVVVVPLAWNNMVRVDGGLGITSATWRNICDGAEGADGRFRLDASCVEPFELLPAAGWEGRSASISRERAAELIGDAPVRWVARAPLRFVHSFDLGGWGVAVSQDWSGHLGRGAFADAAYRVSQVGFVAVLVAAAVGLTRRRRQLRQPRLARTRTQTSRARND
jgi:hypothetical protein